MVSRKALILTATALAAAVPNLAELRAASRIVVWGGDRYGVTAVPEGLTNVVERSGALLRRPDHLADESSGRFGPSQLAQSLSELNGRRFQLQRSALSRRDQETQRTAAAASPRGTYVRPLVLQPQIKLLRSRAPSQ